jgi:hypothetical protein
MNNSGQIEETINNGRKEKGVEDAMESSFRLDSQVSATPMEQEQDDGMLKNSERASQKSEDFHTCHESFDVSTSYSDTVLTHERNSASVKNRDWEDFDRRIVGDGVWWEPGSRISIIGGKYKGRHGTYLGVTASKKSMIVNVDGHGEKRLLMKSVGPFVGDKSPEMYRSSKTYKISMGDTVGTIMHKYVKSEQSIPEYEKENDDFRMPDYNSGGMKFGDDVVTMILVSTKRDYLRNS